MNVSQQGAAISLDKLQKRAPGLVSLAKQAGVSLEKRGLSGQRAAVYLVLDRSGSMRGYYRDGSCQELAERVLGLSANLDDDGVVPLVFFDDRAYAPVEVNLSNYPRRVNTVHDSLGRMGRTNYSAAMRAVVAHYQASGATDPALVVFQTDGNPDDRADTERALREFSNLPIFWSFVGFGGRVSFLEKLDELSGRAVDNASFMPAGADPRRVADAELYDQLLKEFPQWLRDVRAAGIIR